MFQKLKRKIKDMYCHHVWDRCVGDVSLDKFLTSYYKSIGESAIEYLLLRTTPVFPTSTYLKVVQLTAKKILILREVMGVQPITSPAGLVFSLRVNQKSEHEMTMTIERDAVLAKCYPTVEIAIAPYSIAPEMKDAYIDALATEIADAIVRSAMTEFIRTVKPPAEQPTPAPMTVSIAETAKEPAPCWATLSIPTEPITVSPISKDNLIFRLNAISSQIAARTRRGAGNVILTSPGEGASLLCLNGSFKFESDDFKKLDGLYKAGTIDLDNGRSYVVMVSSCVPKNQLILTYKGNSDVDAAFILCPYLILGAEGGPSAETFEPKLRLFTRMGSWHGNPDYHQAVNLPEM